MPKKLYVSTNEAAYFSTNVLKCGDQPPKEGEHKVGDIVISTKQENDVLGWVCIKAGNPGQWKVICDIVEVNKNIKLNKDEINNLIQRASAAEKVINTIINKNEEQSTSINNLNKELNDLEGNVNKNNQALLEKINNNSNSITNINSQIDLAKKSLTTLSGQVLNNATNITKLEKNVNDNKAAAEKSINDLTTVVNKNAEDGAKVAQKIANDVTEIKQFVGIGEGTQSGPTLQTKIDDINEIIGNYSEGENPATGIKKEIEDLKDYIGLGDADEGENTEPTLEGRIEELEDTVGKPSIDENPATGIIKEIEDLKEIIGGNADDAEQAATGLQKEINDIKDFIGLGDNDDGEESGGNLLDQVGENKVVLDALASTVGSVDINSKDVISSGELVGDINASHGKSYHVVAGQNDTTLYKATMDDIKFGQYGICVRMMCTSVDTTNPIVRLRVINGATNILTKEFKSSDFNGDYALIYGAFEYKSNGNTKQNLQVQIDVLANAGVEASFDYAYVNMIIPAVFL